MSNEAQLEAAKARLLTEIEATLELKMPATLKSRAILAYAEAHAWLERPDQPHGGSITIGE